MNDPRHPTSPMPVSPQSPQAPHGQPHAPHAPPQPHAPRPPMAPAPARPGISPMPTMKPPHDDLEPIALIEDEPVSTLTQGMPPPPTPKKIVALGDHTHRQQTAWKRQPIRTGHGACRVRSFHGKYSEQGLEYLDNAVNEWLDSHPEVEVKFVTSTVMTFEGKIREPALVLNLWY